MSGECLETFCPHLFSVWKVLYSISTAHSSHTQEERAKSWTSPQRNLFSFLQTCRMMPGFKSSISPSLLSVASQPPHLRLKGTLSLEQFQHVEKWHMGEKDIGAGHRREIEVRETENSLWKKVYLSLRKQIKSKAGHRCSKSAKWWSNGPLLHCLWQTLQVHFSSPGKHQKVPREDQFYPDLFYSSLLGRVYCSFSVFVVPDDSAILLAIIFLPLL